MLEAFSPQRAAEGALVPMSAEGLLAAEATSREIAFLERYSRRNKVRAWVFGVSTALWAGMGGLAAVGSTEEAAFFLTMGGLSGVGAAVTATRGRRQGADAQSRRQRQRALQVLALARAERGVLNVTLVAAHLGLDLREAEAVLDAMIDGRRVDMQVDAEGRVTYVFPELQG